MYTQIFFVTSVGGIDFPPQIAANAGLRVFGAKSPTPLLLHGRSDFLARRLRRGLAEGFLRRLQGRLSRLRERRLRRRGRNRRLRHSD